MTPDEIKAFFRSVYMPGKAWGTPEMLDEFYAHIAPDFVFYRPPFPPVAGIEKNRKDDEAMGLAFTDSVVKIIELIVEGNVSVLRYTWEGTHTGVSPNLGIPPTGKRVHTPGCAVYHWKGDKIVEMWDYLDLLGLLQQVGVIPALA